MSKELRFDGRSVIVTGAGGGLGRSHALLFASRGAKVVVNDLGGAMTGEGQSSSAADRVVDEIRAAGGEAVASYDSVEDGKKIVKTALDVFGRVDVVVNNAGILRDKSFAKMTEEDWELVYRVHVLGAFRITHAAWPLMREQQYGRIVMTASAAGLYGNFGQANYSMAKLGLAGLSNTLAIEGRTKNVHVNTIAPLAGSRLTETVMPKALVDALKPEYVSPLVAYLCHEDTNETGGIFEVGGGYFGKLRWERAAGSMKRLGRAIAPEDIARDWEKIAGFDETTHPEDVMQSMQPIVDNVSAGPSLGGNDLIDVDAALGYEFPELYTSYDERDLAIYALGVGAAEDPNGAELPLVYELHQDGFKALPTYAVVPAVSAFLDAAKDGMQAPGLNYGLDRILHGEQHTTLIRPLPPRANLVHRARVKEILDKGKNALVNIEMRTSEESGELLVINNLIMVVRGAGGWGGARGEGQPSTAPPDRAPDATIEEKTAENQALLYRLSGDWNPLHADPGFAKAFGFERPILHGLCTLGFAGRHVVRAFSNDDPRYVRRFGVRMADSVFPGETLVTDMWKVSDTTILFVTRVKERDAVVLKNGVVELFAELPSDAPKAAPEHEVAEDDTKTVVPMSTDVFMAIARYVQENPSLVKQAGRVFRFELSNPDSAWTIDLKTEGGRVREGREGEADTTLALTDDDFMKMCTGESDAQQMFMKGQLKITGDVMASQKLEFLKKLDPAWVFESAAARRGGSAPEASVSSAEEVVVDLEPTSSRAAAIAEQMNASIASDAPRIQIVLTDPAGAIAIDPTTVPAAQVGTMPRPDATLTIPEKELVALLTRERSAQELYQRGLLRVDGSLDAARRLWFLGAQR